MTFSMSALVSARDSRIKPDRESDFKRYQTISICTMTLESVCKIYPKRWYSIGNSFSIWRINLSQLFRFKLFHLFSNTLKCVNLIEIQFYVYFYMPSLLVFWHIMFDTTMQTPEVEFGSQISILALRAKSQHWLPAIIGHAKTNILQQNMW